MDKDRYIEYVNNNFDGKAKELVLKQIELFYKDVDVEKNHYNIGDDVFLKKGTFLHGLGGNPDAFDWIVDNGFIANDFNGRSKNKIFNSIGMWNIKEDCYLRDYIKFYSGAVIKYEKGRGPGAVRYYDVVPFGEVEENLIKYNNMEDVWTWYADQTKEIRFMPSLASNKIQIGFILNMESDYAKEMAYYDVFNKDFDESVLKYFCMPGFLNELFNEPITPVTTDRESAIFFGLPKSLIEGVIVGRIYEKDLEKLDYIKSKLPDAYICNVDGKVIK